VQRVRANIYNKTITTCLPHHHPASQQSWLHRWFLAHYGVRNSVAHSQYFNTAHSATRFFLVLHPNAEGINSKVLNVDYWQSIFDDRHMSLLEAAIGLLAPPDCLNCGAEGYTLCRNCSASAIKPFGQRCWHCNSLSPESRTCIKCRHLGPLSFVWISTNYEGIAQNLVRRYKFGHLRAAAESLARIMGETFLAINEANEMTTQSYLVMPLPTATSRARQRGFGHSELLAKTIAANLRLEYSNGLRRLGQSRQLGARREDRLVQLADSFAVKNPQRLAGRKIILIDDVLTTGGSLISAAKTLKAAGAQQVSALVFAKRL
jgi:ComF family protein